MAETYNVYVDTGDGLTLVAAGISDLYWAVDFGPLLYNNGYSWRVDAINEYGTTTGDVWTFTSLVFNPPLPTGISLTDVEGDEGEQTGTPTGANNMITVRKLIAAANNKIWLEDI